ncbi:hypothetical protein HYY75_11345 [bacterium]|nr:hypothetical protein [bacterium]
MLLLSLAALLGMSLFVLDFLDILQFRYKIPENIRKKWPLSAYFDFVRLNQLPDEERYKILLQRQKEMYDTLISEGSSDLKKRAEELDSKYRELVRAQEDLLKKRQGDLAKLQEENIKEKKRLDDLNQDVSKKKEIADALSKQVASEALNLESSLIRFMEGESRLKAVQEVCASMDPRSIASIFDEVADNMLIYNILKGVPPERSALVLSFMDPEKAGKIIKMSTNLPTLPGPNESRSYMPPSLKNLLASSQSLLR